MPIQRSHICFIISDLFPLGQPQGSTATLLRELIEALPSVNYKITIINLETGKSQKLISLKNVNKIYLYKINLRAKYKPFMVCTQYLLNFYNMIKTMKEISPDLFHFYGNIRLGYVAGLCKNFIKKPIIATITRDYRALSYKRELFDVISKVTIIDSYLKKLKRYLLSQIDGIICFNKYFKSTLINLFKLNERKVYQINPCIKREFSKGKQKRINIFNNNRIKILYWGDGFLERGFDIFCELYEEISIRYPKTEFIVAVRNMEKELKSKINLKKKNNLHLFNLEEKPYPFKIQDLVYTSDIIVLPFRTNAMEPPLTIIESMAVGKPVITTNAGGNRELIRNNRTGVLVSPKLDELIEATTYLLDNEKKRKEIGEEAANFIYEHFKWENSVKKIEEIYSKFQ